MIDTLKCLFFSGSITLFANVPQMFEWPIEKIGFGALLFFIIWTYMKHVMPKTQADIDDKNKRIEELLKEIHNLNELRGKDQKIIAALLKEVKQNTSMGGKRAASPQLPPDALHGRLSIDERNEEQKS